MRYAILTLATLALAVAGGVAWIVPGGSGDERPVQPAQSSTEPIPSGQSDTHARPAPGAQADSSAGNGTDGFVPRRLELPPPPAKTVLVDSYPPAAQSDFDAWRQIDYVAGHFDALRRSDTGQDVRSVTSVAGEQVLTASGWAGDPDLGFRYRDVVFAMCGKVVARTQVTANRPDVAESVHPNLERSGWTASLLAGDLPNCTDASLTAWAVAPGSTPALVRLLGAFVVPVQREASVTLDRVSQQEDIRPDAYPPVMVSRIEVRASKVNVRSCGSTRCEVLSQVVGGRYRVVVADNDGEWSLLLFGDKAGWMANSLYAVVE